MTRPGNEFPPAVTIQEAVDARDLRLMLHLGFEGLLNVLGGGNLSPFSLSEKGLQKSAFLLQAHVLMTASTLAWGFNRSHPQTLVGGNDAPHCLDRHPHTPAHPSPFPTPHPHR